MAHLAVNDPSANFSDRLREHRRAVGLTQEELAERAGVSPRSISEMERGGAHVPRRDTVAMLVRALGLVGPDRVAFEALVDGRRRPRRSPTLEQTPIHQAPSAEITIERPRHNLPRPLISFVGREQELSELGRDRPTAALLTLVGAGGVGKTRLAQELEQLADRILAELVDQVVQIVFDGHREFLVDRLRSGTLAQPWGES